MAMVIANNNAAMLTLGELNKNTTALGKQLKKVSSGMRINSAADDASGYAISERMRVQIRSLDQDWRNTQTGTNLLNVADGAVASTVEILRTMKEKAINAANDTNTDRDRASMQKEYDQLIDQIDDNANVTFNGRRLVDGSNNRKVIATQTSLTNQMLSTDTTGQTAFTAMQNRQGESLGIDAEDTVEISWTKDGETHKASVTGTENIEDLLEAANEVVGTEGTTIITTETVTVYTVHDVSTTDENQVMRYYPLGIHFNIGTENFVGGFGTVYTGQRINAIREKFDNYISTSYGVQNQITTVPAMFENIFANHAYLASDHSQSATAEYCKYHIVTNGALSTIFSVDEVYDAEMNPLALELNDTLIQEILRTEYNSFLGIGVYLDYPVQESTEEVTTTIITPGEGAVFEATALDGNILGTDASGSTVYTPDYTKAITIRANDSGVDGQVAGVTFAVKDSEGNIKRNATEALNAFSETIRGENESEDNALVIHTGTKANQAVKVYLTDMRSAALGLKGSDGKTLSIGTQAHANTAINVLDSALQKALNEETRLGAYISRLEYTAANLVTANESTQSSESTLRDADMAKEMAEYTKANVLAQAAQSMLAQANQNASSVLSLLQ